MSGNTNFPTGLDDDTSLINVTDGVTAIEAAHHNNLKEAAKALEAKVGIFNTSAPTSLDYRIGHPTSSHLHSAASGQGARINASNILDLSARFTPIIHLHGSALVGSNLAAPIVLGRTMQIENISAALRRGPSGATAAFILRVGPTHLYGASVGLGVRFAPGATLYGHASPNVSTYPSGAIITLDAEAIGSSDPGQDLSVIFVFRE